MRHQNTKSGTQVRFVHLRSRPLKTVAETVTTLRTVAILNDPYMTRLEESREQPHLGRWSAHQIPRITPRPAWCRDIAGRRVVS